MRNDLETQMMESEIAELINWLRHHQEEVIMLKKTFD